MPISWLKREETLPDLIARKKYERAIQVLREKLAESAPTVPVRLQLADVLVLAGRGREAVPLFLELADDFARDHFIARRSRSSSESRRSRLATRSRRSCLLS